MGSLSIAVVVSLVLVVLAVFGAGCAAGGGDEDSLVFIHHSCGRLWLNKPSRWPWSKGLHEALLAKSYISRRHDITYGVALAPDMGRPDSLGPVTGDKTDMAHWAFWFNDYLEAVKTHGCRGGVNRIVMYKSCYPNSDVQSDGPGPGDPFDETRTVANYQAVYRHPGGPGHAYSRDGVEYRPLEDVFAANPEFLFIAVTAPPLHFAPEDATSDDAARRARSFNNWLKNDWLAGYRERTGLNNVAVYDWFDALATADDASAHPNRLRSEYGGAQGDSHPNKAACAESVRLFAAAKDSFLDRAWTGFRSQTSE